MTAHYSPTCQCRNCRIVRADEARDEVLAEVVGTFFGAPRAPRARAKPHRCFNCGKVTRHIFCPACSAERRRNR